MKSFDNKVAAITGAGSGIGRALALQLAEEHCHLALSDINLDSVKETAEMAKKKGVKVVATKLDVADKKAVEAWANKTQEEFGKVNLIFNNAGVAQAGTVSETSMEDYEWLMGINFWGVLYGTKAFLPLLKQSGEGHVVNISSIFGLFSQPGMSAYNASKFAVRGLTESLRQELDLEKCGVSATSIHPGGIRTNIAKNARMDESMSQVAGGDTTADALRNKFDEFLLRTTPEKAAQVILSGVKRNARRVLIGADASAVDTMQRLLPQGYQKIVSTSMKLLRFG